MTRSPRETVDRVPSGIAGLDELIEGGFPRGNLIVLSGPPGAGKTIFGFQFLYEGIRRGETGMFVTFLEDKKSFYSNFEHIGFDLKEMDDTGRFNFMSLLTTKEAGVSGSLKTMVSEIAKHKVTLLVIDSFTAMKEAFKDTIEARIILNTILGKMVRMMGCTTLLIVEKAPGSERAGLGMEEFVADGVINLESFMDRLEMRRRVLISKMRGTNHSLRYQGVVVGNKGMRLTPIVG
ncbi:MAG: AAA family ATPase [Thaumarchaeota archaeon]|nr:AAA family ATPase [Nitrososphaerota archaeon]